MEAFDRKKHWENIYSTKELTEVSWYQPKPETSLNFLQKARLPKDAAIIDIGGGDSFLADYLLEMGYSDITVLDISEAALKRAKARLGGKAEKINWIVADATSYSDGRQYDFWHDRAAFHFLTSVDEIESYTANASLGVKPCGMMVIGTFSDKGPLKCSGIEIKQYSQTRLVENFKADFEVIECLSTEHPTPFNTVQAFTFCSFRKK